MGLFHARPCHGNKRVQVKQDFSHGSSFSRGNKYIIQLKLIKYPKPVLKICSIFSCNKTANRLLGDCLTRQLNYLGDFLWKITLIFPPTCKTVAIAPFSPDNPQVREGAGLKGSPLMDSSSDEGEKPFAQVPQGPAAFFFYCICRK